MALSLRPLSLLDGEREWLFLQELEKEKNGFGNDGHGLSLDEFPAYLMKKIRDANAIDQPTYRVPQSTYWLIEDDKILAIGNIRHYLTEGLLEHGGHIGYAVHPDFRGQGYGKKLLALLIEKSRLKGIDSVLITCNQDNIGSRRVIETNGGQLWKENDQRRWYWITL